MTLKKYLSQFTPEQLTEQIAELVKIYPDVKLYFQYHQDPESRTVHDKLETKIRDLCYPKRGRYPKFKKANEVIAIYKKLCPPPEDMAQLLYTRLERSTQFSLHNGLFDYASVWNTLGRYEEALLEFIAKEHLGRAWKEKAKAVLEEFTT